MEEWEIRRKGLEFFKANAGIARIWEFSPAAGAPQLALPVGRDHVIPGSDIHLVWPFTVGRLILISPDTLTRATTTVGIRCGVLFDSNLYDGLCDFVDNRERLSRDQQNGIANLIELLNAWNYDYQALPYVIEQYANNKLITAREYAFRITKALLTLHAMDVEYFRATHEIRYDVGAFGELVKEHGTDDINVIAAHQLGAVGTEFGREPPIVKFYALCLMKLVVIRRKTHKKKGIAKQCEAFDSFVFRRVRFLVSSMRFLALSYFAGRCDRLVPSQVGSDVANQLKQIRNTAWDLFLGMLPEQLLALSEEPIADAYFFCTREAQLAQMLAASAVRGCVVDRDGTFVPYREMDDALLAILLGSSHAAYMRDSKRRLEEHAELRRKQRTTPIDPSDLNDLYAEVEDQFRDALEGK